MENFGSYLKTEREKKGIRLEEIASITKIHIHSLELLEGGRWEQLPPEPFIRGFIIAYAKYVGMDPKDAVRRYQAEANPKPLQASSPAPQVELATARPVRAPHASEPGANEWVGRLKAIPAPRLVVAGAGLGLLFITIGIIYIGKQAGQDTSQSVAMTDAPASEGASSEARDLAASSPGKGSEKSDKAEKVEKLDRAEKAEIVATPAITPPPKAEEPKKIIQAAAPAATQVNTPNAAPAAGSDSGTSAPVLYKHEIIAEIPYRSWTKVVIDEEPPIERYTNPGEKVELRAKKKIKFTLGNSVDAKVSYNGQPVDGKVFRGTIKYYIFPLGARFPQDVVKKAEAEAPVAPGAAPPTPTNPTP